jgi:anthranilate phosphoribosyltransferase
VGSIPAIRTRLHRIPTHGQPTVVLPSYNGARKLPLLTPLLALLLAREGLAVVVHGCATENTRVHIEDVLIALGIQASDTLEIRAPGELHWVPTRRLHAGLVRVLKLREVLGLRNSAHSLVKLMNPCLGQAWVVGSYTHPEYAQSMAQTWSLMGADGLLLRGTEGEPVADPRRQPALTGFVGGQAHELEPLQTGSLAYLPDLPPPDVASTVAYTRAVLAGEAPIPAPIARQVAHLLRLAHGTTH